MTLAYFDAADLIVVDRAVADLEELERMASHAQVLLRQGDDYWHFVPGWGARGAPLPQVDAAERADEPVVIVRRGELVGAWLEPAEEQAARAAPPARSAPPPAYESAPPAPGDYELSEPPPPARARRAPARRRGGGLIDRLRRRFTPPPDELREEPVAADGGSGPSDEMWAEPVAANGGSGPPAERLRRTPHLDAPDEPQPVGASFQARVWADAGEAADEEQSVDIEIAAPAGVTEFPMSVWLSTSDHFTVEGDNVKSLTLERDEDRSEDVLFDVRVVRAPETEDEEAVLTAVFSYNGRPCGRVTRAVAIAEGPAPVTAPEAPAPGPPSLRVDAEAAQPDITVTIAGDPARARTYEVQVESPLLDAYRTPQTGEWPLPESVPAIVGGFFQEFVSENLTPFQRIAALKGAGVQLFDSAPEIFRRLFWDLIDAGIEPRTIFIVSEEPDYPWELMVPRRRRRDGGGSERRAAPLGVEFAVGRWVRRDHQAGEQHVALAEAHVLAPDYGDDRRNLPSAEAEAQFVCERFNGTRIDPASVERFDAVLGAQPRPLIHFIGHGVTTGESGAGEDREGAPIARAQQVNQVLAMQGENGEQTLTLTQLAGLTGVETGISTGRPLVFINACEVGRAVPALAGIGGFAEIFTEMGATAVIAPLWSVEDTIAHEIAREFYTRIADDPGARPSEILRDIRARAYRDDGADTYAAYCLYGDPLMRCSVAG
jgi:hypothetical protein